MKLFREGEENEIGRHGRRFAPTINEIDTGRDEYRD